MQEGGLRRQSSCRGASPVRFLRSLQVYKAVLNVFVLTFISLDATASFNTGYNWSHVTDSTKNEQTAITVEAVAPAGLTKPESENDNIFPNLRLGPDG